jgi:hypothetical protein
MRRKWRARERESERAMRFWAPSQNCEKRTLAFNVRASICLSSLNDSALTGRIFMKSDIPVFF